MGYPSKTPSPQMIDSPTADHYNELMEQSARARKLGDHWAAQKHATAAHKWAMDERTRLQRLAQARESLINATKRLNSTMERDPECRTIVELQERHPEFKSVVTAWEKAEQLVRDLDQPQSEDVAKAKKK